MLCAQVPPRNLRLYLVDADCDNEESNPSPKRFTLCSEIDNVKYATLLLHHYQGYRYMLRRNPCTFEGFLPLLSLSLFNDP